MSNIALIGKKELILGFSLVGFTLFPVVESEEAINALRDCLEKDYAIVFITNEIAQDIIEEIKDYQKSSSMTICILPNRARKSELSITLLRKNVEKAVGTDILFRKED